MPIVYSGLDPDERELGINTAVSSLKSGRLAVLPTDTLYGICCDAFDADAVAGLLAAKKRGPDMPVPVLVSSWHTIDGLVMSVPPVVRTLIKAFWPGALSLVMQQAPSLSWNLGDTEGTVMVRMPLHPLMLDVIKKVGPLAVSSANVSGHPPATTAAQAVEQLGDDVAVYVDSGSCPLGAPSTIVDVTGVSPLIIREGAISAEKIAEVTGLSVEELRGH